MPKATRKKPRDADLIRVLGAYSAGLRSILERHLPRSATKRLRISFDGLLEEAKVRMICDGEAAGIDWLVAQLRSLRLADRRKGKSLDDDKVLVDRYVQLKRAVVPIFQRHPRNSLARMQQAAPLVSKILQQHVVPQTLSPTRAVGQFCLEALNTNHLRLSLARRRLSGRAAQHGRRAVRLLKALASSTKDPKLKARARRALVPARKVLSEYSRRKLL